MWISSSDPRLWPMTLIIYLDLSFLIFRSKVIAFENYCLTTNKHTDPAWCSMRTRKWSVNIRFHSVAVYVGWNDVTVIYCYNTISMLCGNMSCCVKLSDEDLSCYWNKIESVGLRKCLYFAIFLWKWCHNNKRFAYVTTLSGGKQLAYSYMWYELRNYVNVPYVYFSRCQPLIAAEGERKMKMNETFFTGYRKTQLRPTDVLLSIDIPFTNEVCMMF